MDSIQEAPGFFHCAHPVFATRVAQRWSGERAMIGALKNVSTLSVAECKSSYRMTLLEAVGVQ